METLWMKRLFLPALLVLCLFSCSKDSYTQKNTQKGPLFLISHFTTLQHTVPMSDLEALLQGNDLPLKRRLGLVALQVYVDESIAPLVQKTYPSLECTVAPFSRQELANQPGFIGITDINGLDPRYHILALNDRLPWGVLTEKYTLEPVDNYPFTIEGIAPFNAENHITVVQTGVTAMTRAFIRAVEKSGDVLMPVQHTAAITRAADLAMTSNEVSFTMDCSYPFPNNMLFCSPRKYFEILKHSGFDVIEVTGNHNNDYGRKYSTCTLNLYKNNGMTVFGGGLNEEEAYSIKYRQIKGKIIAFIGFNQWGPALAWAKGDQPGAAKLSRNAFDSSIKEAVEKADVVFVSVQWGNENNPIPHAIQTEYFRRAARLGATIMVSSSAHRAMGLEFHRGKFISFGLGNFLFDQMQSINHRSGMIARHHFYNGRHINTELIPYLIHNWSQPVPVHGREKQRLLEYVFKYSRGDVFK